jgi:NAD(P)-dependent dehydrogenase (short-subunit alcohol dehydrogenase family)
VGRTVRRDRGTGRHLRAFVTGGGRGLGQAVVERLRRDGGRVCVVDIRPASGVDLVGDVSDADFVGEAVAFASERLGGLDVLVNNAGIGGPSTTVVDTDPAAFRRVLDVNLVGSFLTARAAAGVMVAQGDGGAIVNIGSIFGEQGVANAAAYCASKGGVALLTHSLALELAPHGVRVNTVAPGNMATEMHWDELRARAAARGTSFELERERLAAEIPLGRHGTGDDVAGAVAWLVSEDAAYVTGQTIGVNGGVYLT